MRTIKVEKWPAKNEKGEDTQESTLDVIKTLVMLRTDNANAPKGLDTFRCYSRINKAIEEAEKNGTLNIEEADYLFLKKQVESGIPAAWGLNKSIVPVIEALLELKAETK